MGAVPQLPNSETPFPNCSPSVPQNLAGFSLGEEPGETDLSYSLLSSFMGGSPQIWTEGHMGVNNSKVT